MKALRLLMREMRTSQGFELSYLLGSIFTWLFFIYLFGFALSALVKPIKDLSYIEFMIPGIVVLSAFSSSMTAGTSLWVDKKLGMFERLLTMFSRNEYIAIKILSGTIQGVLIGTTITLCSLPVARVNNYFYLLLGMFLSSLFFCSLSLIISTIVKRAEGINVILSALQVPLVLLSPAFYPLDSIQLIENVAIFNPLTHFIEITRYSVGLEPYLGLKNEMIIAIILTLLSLIAVWLRVSLLKIENILEET